MSTMTKVFIVLTAVMAIIHSSLTVATAARWSNAKQQLENYQQLYQSELVRRISTEGVMAAGQAIKDDQIAQLTRALGKREDELRASTDELAAARIDLARQTNDRAAAEAGRKKLEEILEVQTAELTSAQKQNQVLLSENIDLQTRIQRLSSRVLELTSQGTIASDEIRNLQAKLYAEQQKNRAGSAAVPAMERSVLASAEAPPGVIPVNPPVAGPIRGEVSLVDGRYVSINVGESSGVVAGLTFMIYRGGTYVGDLVIEQVRPTESGGKMAFVALGQVVQRGDSAEFGIDR